MAALQNQIVLVTGCSSGIGLGLVRELKRLGHTPVASARRAQSIDELKAEGFDAVQLDVVDRPSVDRAIAEVLERHGRIDVLINNAGFNVYGPLLEAPIEDLDRLFRTNVIGLISVSQAVFPHMAKRRSGRIVNIGSVVGVMPTPFAAGYCATKSAVHTLSDVMRQEVAPFGIEVVVVQPGGVRSSIADNGAEGVKRYDNPQSMYHRIYSHIQKRAFASQAAPMETEDFARRTLAQALAKSAPRVVRQGRGATALPALSKLPGPVLDRIMLLQSGLKKLRD
ncbi:MAG: SDR family oxidoreductase [Polyangiaceae bacterium]